MEKDDIELDQGDLFANERELAIITRCFGLKESEYYKDPNAWGGE